MAKLKVVLNPPPKKVGPEIVKNLLEPEIEAFSVKFQQLAGSPLTRMEKEILKAFLYHKIVNDKGSS